MNIVKVDDVLSTTEYNIFESIVGNRAVLDSRKARIISSIKERGWIMNPIIVNESFKIIDGSGRFEALKELGMPIYFVISKGATIDDCIALNIKQQNWKNADYINCYATIGYKDYSTLQKLIELYGRALGSEGVFIMASNKGNSGGCDECIKTGNFSIMDYDSLYTRMDYAKSFFDLVGRKYGRARTWVIPLKFAFFNKSIDHELLMDKISKYQSFLQPCATYEQALRLFEKIYNYHIASNNKVYFIEEFDRDRNSKK